MSINTGKSCCFFGHRDVSDIDSIKEQVKSVVTEIIENEGFDTFYFGGLGDFDDLCFEVLHSLKEKYPHIRLVFCFTDDRSLRKGSYDKTKKGFDECICLPLECNWWYTWIYYRNIAVISVSDLCVFYADPTAEKSGARKALSYAVLKKKRFINLFPTKG